jgi:hypothetical protein
MDRDTLYRVEHRDRDGGITVLYYGKVSLDALATQLEAEGEGGDLVLVEVLTGRVHEHRSLSPQRPRPHGLERPDTPREQA